MNILKIQFRKMLVLKSLNKRVIFINNLTTIVFAFLLNYTV